MALPVPPPVTTTAPPAQPVPLQSSLVSDIFGKVREIGQERAMLAAMEQLEKPENQERAAAQIRKLPEPGKSSVIRALGAVAQLASMPGGRRRTRRVRRTTAAEKERRARARSERLMKEWESFKLKGGQNGAIQQLESNNTSYGGLSPAQLGGNLGAVQQMVANQSYTVGGNELVTPSTVYPNPWGGKRHTKKRKLTRRHK